MVCRNHKNEIAIEKCSSCGQWYCDDCITIVDKKVICNHCSGEKTPNRDATPIKETFEKQPVYTDADYLQHHKEKKQEFKNQTLEFQQQIVEETQDGIRQYSNSSDIDSVTLQSLQVQKKKMIRKFVASIVLFFVGMPILWFIGIIIFITAVIDLNKYMKYKKYYQ